jgi:hypothetical protein
MASWMMRLMALLMCFALASAVLAPHQSGPSRSRCKTAADCPLERSLCVVGMCRERQATERQVVYSRRCRSNSRANRGARFLSFCWCALLPLIAPSPHDFIKDNFYCEFCVGVCSGVSSSLRSQSDGGSRSGSGVAETLAAFVPVLRALLQS